MLIGRDLLQMIEALGGSDGLTYLSVPITSGRRELDFMRRLHVRDPAEARRRDPERWRREVVIENERDANRSAARVRAADPTTILLNPATLRQDGWSQDDFNRLWLDVVERYAKTVAVAPGWELSRGARVEVGAALALGRPVVDVDLHPRSTESLIELAERARADLADGGWSSDELASVLPVLRIERPVVVPSAQAQTFEWLVGERQYQLQKFGTELDDAHTAVGLQPDGWWQRQLLSYLHRASVLGLELPVGRQALAKFVATGCGVLESVVRVHGPLPPPGVSSGELGEG